MTMYWLPPIKENPPLARVDNILLAKGNNHEGTPGGPHELDDDQLERINEALGLRGGHVDEFVEEQAQAALSELTDGIPPQASDQELAQAQAEEPAPSDLVAGQPVPVVTDEQSGSGTTGDAGTDDTVDDGPDDPDDPDHVIP